MVFVNPLCIGLLVFQSIPLLSPGGASYTRWRSFLLVSSLSRSDIVLPLPMVLYIILRVCFFSDEGLVVNCNIF